MQVSLPGQPSERPTERFRLSHGAQAGHASEPWAVGLVIAAAVLFSTGGAAIKTGAFSALQVSSARSGIAAVALLLFVGGRCSWSAPILATGVAYATTLTLFVAATKQTTAASAIFLQASAPLYLLILGPWLLRERLGGRDLGYAAATAVGLAICFFGQAPASATAPDPAAGNLLAMFSSVTWAITLVGLRRVTREVTPGGAISAVIVGNILASVAVLPWALPFPEAPPLDWAALVYLGVVQIGVAYLCLTRALGHLPALDVSLLLLLEPVLNPVWTWLVRSEHPGTWVIVGGACILAASAARAWRDAVAT